jgi:hypothetical protein
MFIMNLSNNILKYIQNINTFFVLYSKLTWIGAGKDQLKLQSERKWNVPKYQDGALVVE